MRHITLAEHIAWFTPKTKFRERKFLRFLRRERLRKVKRRPENNKQPAID